MRHKYMVGPLALPKNLCSIRLHNFFLFPAYLSSLLQGARRGRDEKLARMTFCQDSDCILTAIQARSASADRQTGDVL